MKNPYLQSRQVTLRHVVFATAVLLLIAKAVVVIAWFNSPESFERLPGHGRTAVGVGLTEILDIVAAFYVTGGWYDLFRRRWAILVSAPVNVVLGAGAVGIYAWLTRGAMDLNNMVWGGLAAVALAVAVVELAASVMIYGRLGKASGSSH